MKTTKILQDRTVEETLIENAKHDFRRRVSTGYVYLDVDDYVRLIGELGSKVKYMEHLNVPELSGSYHAIAMNVGFGVFFVIPVNGDEK